MGRHGNTWHGWQQPAELPKPQGLRVCSPRPRSVPAIMSEDAAAGGEGEGGLLMHLAAVAGGEGGLLLPLPSQAFQMLLQRPRLRAMALAPLQGVMSSTRLMPTAVATKLLACQW